MGQIFRSTVFNMLNFRGKNEMVCRADEADFRIAALEAERDELRALLDEAGEVMWNGNCESCEKVGAILAKRP